MKKLHKKYNIPQEVLYSVCITAWKLCGENLEKFAGLKAYYTKDYIDSALLGVEQARQLPALTVTKAELTEARLKLQNGAAKVLENWQMLKVYVMTAYDIEMAKVMLEASGSAFYAKASHHSWMTMHNLIIEMHVFIKNHLEELIANDNMPAAFQAKVAVDGEAFMALSDGFYSSKMDKSSRTSDKIEANDAIYQQAIKMLKDAQQIFRHDAAKKQQFTFSYLASLFQGEKSSALKGYILDAVRRPVKGVIIESEDQKYTAITNEKGYYFIRRIAEGTYTFTITCPGYNPLVQVMTFAAATASKGDFAMTKVLSKVA